MKCPVCEKTVRGKHSYCSGCGWSLTEDSSVHGSLFGGTQKKEYEDRVKIYRNIVRGSADAEGRLKDLQGQLDTAKKECRKLQGELANAKDVGSGAEKESTATKKTTVEDDKRRKEAEKQLELLRVQYKDVNKKLEATSTQLREANTKLESTSTQLKEATTKLEKTTTQLGESNAELEKTNKQLEDAKGQIGQLKNDLYRVQGERDRLNRDASSARSGARRAEQTATEVKSQNSKLEQEVTRLEKKVQADAKEIKVITDKHKKRTDKLESQIAGRKFASGMLASFFGLIYGLSLLGYSVNDFPLRFFGNDLMDYGCDFVLEMVAVAVGILLNMIIEWIYKTFKNEEYNGWGICYCALITAMIQSILVGAVFSYLFEIFPQV